MDALDRKILAELQVDGRLSVTELGSRVGLTVSPAHRRVRDLEASGAIVGYHAVVDPKVLGLGFEALVFVTMERSDRATLLAFEDAAASIPNVLQGQRLFGDPDFLLRVRTKDMDAYAQLEEDVMSTLPGVLRLNSTLVMKNFVINRPYPTDLE